MWRSTENGFPRSPITSHFVLIIHPFRFCTGCLYVQPVNEELFPKIGTTEATFFISGFQTPVPPVISLTGVKYKLEKVNRYVEGKWIMFWYRVFRWPEESSTPNWKLETGVKNQTCNCFWREWYFSFTFAGISLSFYHHMPEKFLWLDEYYAFRRITNYPIFIT